MDTASLVHPPKTLAVAAVLLSLLAALAACERPRRGPYPYAIEADDARGLKKGASVTIAGVEVGKVRAVSLAGRKARIDLAVTQDGLLTEGTCARIAAYGMAGDMHVELDPPTGKRPLPDGHVITCVRVAVDHDKQLDRVFRSVVAILELAATGKGVIGRLLRDEKLADQMEAWFRGGGVAAPVTTLNLDSADEPAADAAPEPPVAAPGPMPVPPVVPPTLPKPKVPAWKPPPKQPPPKSTVVPPF
ncbi:MAG: MCE family protein [Deltaproteobacteria bacterium]|nr:MCE family protein [Deltaproteobacteria bacterium]